VTRVSPRRTAAQAEETRTEVLAAAFRVVRGGVGKLTIDAVAREAGASKGAVLHHFPSKEALVVGMVERVLDAFEEAIGRWLATEPEGSGRWLRAYVRASFELGPGDLAVSEALLAAVATNPEVLALYEERFEDWRRRSEADGLDPTRAAVVRLAVDGLASAEMFGLGPPEGEKRKALLEALVELTRRREPVVSWRPGRRGSDD
jgi:AcrR family transcriptional regulator